MEQNQVPSEVPQEEPTLSQEESFLLSILENPLERASRLVYADWLEDQGDPMSADLRRDDGFLSLWADGSLFWRLEMQGRTYLLGQLSSPFPDCANCGSTTGGRRTCQGGRWKCDSCS